MNEESIKVIGVGLGRTGTTSIQRALEVLGYRAYNFEAVIYNEQFNEWREVVEGKEADWHALFDGYDSSISWPACFFYQELLTVYPNAKFILTVRDPERWAESVGRVITNFPKLKPFRFIPRVRAMLNLMETLVIPRFGSFDPDKSHLMGVIEQHNAAVKKAIPPEKLLIYEVQEGWEPLCTFLGHPLPDAPFPYENQGDNFVKQLLERFIRNDTAKKA